MGDVPESEIEPGAHIGQARRLETVEIAHRALQADRRRMQRTDRGKASARAVDGDDRDVALALTLARVALVLVEDGHVHRAGIAPQAEQGPAAGCDLARNEAPAVLAHRDPRVRMVQFAATAFDRVERHGGYPSNFATFWNHATSAGGM